MTTHGDRRCQPRIEEAAGGGAEHAIKGIHNDLQRLRKRLITLTFGFIAPVPDVSHNLRQAMFFSREPGIEKAFGAVLWIRLRHAFHQPDGINQKGADDRRVQAFVVQHQHRIIKPRSRIHHVAARAGVRRHFAEIRRDITSAMHPGKIEMTKRRHRSPVAVYRQAVHRCSFEQKRHDFSFMENLRHQLAIFQVISRQRRFIFGETAVNFVHSIPRVIDRFSFA